MRFSNGCATTTNAQPLVGTLADYLLVTATEMPPVELAHHESPTPLNPLGIKGVGECGVIPIAPAVLVGRGGCSEAVRRENIAHADDAERHRRARPQDSIDGRAMAVRFDDIGNRLKAFRLASGLARRRDCATSRHIPGRAVYRFERGELVKIETLEKLSELLGVSIPTLLGVGVEYLPSAVAYFERIRQVEETASHIIVLAGPISYLLASPDFHQRLAGILTESIPDTADDRKRALSDVAQVMAILAQRKETYRQRRPSIVNLLAASEVGRLLQNGLTGRFDLPERQRRERRAHARAEVEHLVH